MKPVIVNFILSFLIFLSTNLTAQSDHLLWYNQPAENFEESLALGNGKLGATIFGGVSSDKIYLNDATLWSGQPVNPAMNPEAHTYIPVIRDALQNEDYKRADSLNHFVQGSFSESYAPLGTMFIELEHDKPFQNYRRELDISRAVSTLTYEAGGNRFSREYFISHPDNVMIIRMTSEKKQGLNFRIRFRSQLKFKSSANENTLIITGQAPCHADPNYHGNEVVFDTGKGTRFSTLFRIRHSDGRLSFTDSTIELSGSTTAVIFVSVATSFNGFDHDPFREGKDDLSIAEQQIDRAFTKKYKKLEKAHIEDFQSYFNRVTLNLGTSEAPDLPTDERLKRYSEGKEDKNLEVLYFQFGRYLLISTSRTENVPANLQGIWNPYLRPPWSSNYTLNINLEENYWPAEITNLSEMHQSLLGFIGNLAKTGKITAENFYGAGGWAACHNSDIWAMSNPVGDFGHGDPNWANWNMGGTWLSTHLWEHLYVYDG